MVGRGERLPNVEVNMKKKLALFLVVSLSICAIARAFFTVVLNGQSYLIPAKGDTGYSQGVNSLDAYLQALPSGLIQTSGGTMTGNLIMGTGANIQFTSPSLSLWPIYVDNNGNLNVGNLTAGTTTFAILNSTSSAQAGNPVIYVGSGTINALTALTETVSTITVNNAITLPAASVADSALSSNVMLLNSTQTTTGSKTFGGSFSTTTINTPLGLNGQSTVGTTGQVLTSGGPGAVLTWASVPTAGSSTTFTGSNSFGTSSATTSFNGPISTGSSSGNVGSLNMAFESGGAGQPPLWTYFGTVQSTFTYIKTSTATTSTTYVPSSFTQTITPNKATDIVWVCIGINVLATAPNTGVCTATIKRGATDLDTTNNGILSINSTITTTESIYWGMCFPDSPNTTSATTYTVNFKDSSGTCTFNPQNGTGFIAAIDQGGK
jgi:hypothetical protein